MAESESQTSARRAPRKAAQLAERRAGRWGLLAEFDNVNAFIATCRSVRDAGYTRWDSFTPFPVHGIQKTMGIKPTLLPWITFAGGLAGLLSAIFMLWWTNATQFESVPDALTGFKYVVSGKPYFSLPADIPIMFEMTVLFASIVCFLALWVMNLLPRYHHPLFESERFRRVTTDRFFIAVESADPKFDADHTRELLSSEGAEAVEEVEE